MKNLLLHNEWNINIIFIYNLSEIKIIKINNKKKMCNSLTILKKYDLIRIRYTNIISM